MKIVALALLAATLGGCAVYPAPVAVAPEPVYVAPAPAYYGYWGRQSASTTITADRR